MCEIDQNDKYRKTFDLLFITQKMIEIEGEKLFSCFVLSFCFLLQLFFVFFAKQNLKSSKPNSSAMLDLVEFSVNRGLTSEISKKQNFDLF
jgi:hypothetical protein